MKHFVKIILNCDPDCKRQDQHADNSTYNPERPIINVRKRKRNMQAAIPSSVRLLQEVCHQRFPDSMLLTDVCHQRFIKLIDVCHQRFTQLISKLTDVCNSICPSLLKFDKRLSAISKLDGCHQRFFAYFQAFCLLYRHNVW